MISGKVLLRSDAFTATMPDVENVNGVAFHGKHYAIDVSLRPQSLAPETGFVPSVWRFPRDATAFDPRLPDPEHVRPQKVCGTALTHR